MIFIRTNASTDCGFGHLARMRHLAEEFSIRGKDVSFILDKSSELYVDYLKGYDIYSLDYEPACFDQNDDAQRCIDILQNKIVDCVICDDYRIAYDWEYIVKKSGYELLVIDDLANRKHYCDYLVDMKWAGDETYHRYDSLVPDGCIRLLGPDYAILDKAYRNPVGRSDMIKNTIMFSLGGGWDLTLLSGVLRELLKLIPKEKNYTFKPVLGPLSINQQSLIDLASRDSRIKPIIGASSLYEHYTECSLFVGALGTSLYELSALSVPAFTFSLLDNQENQLSLLEDFGHYLHLSHNELMQCSEQKLAELIYLFAENTSRIRELRENKYLHVDGIGAKRIVDTILSDKDVTVKDYTHRINDMSVNAIRISDNAIIRKVSDADINHYLHSRNLMQNRGNMIDSSQISRSEHYRWWFTHERESYLLIYDSTRMLYIWHQLEKYLGKNYLLGGWFVCTEDCTFNIVAAALKWQIDYSCEHHPDANWIAVIKKSNKYVQLLNRYMGFVHVKTNSDADEAIQHFFKMASNDDFEYVKLECSVM